MILYNVAAIDVPTVDCMNRSYGRTWVWKSNCVVGKS